jgi:hypothetical protein
MNCKAKSKQISYSDRAHEVALENIDEIKFEGVRVWVGVGE